MKSSTVNKERFSRKQVLTLVSIKTLNSLPCSDLNVFKTRTVSSLMKRGFVIHENQEIKLSAGGREIAIILEKKNFTPTQRLALILASISFKTEVRWMKYETEMRANFPNFKAFDLNTSTP